MGYWTKDDVVITDVVGPGPNAFHDKHRFYPDSQYQERRVAEIYEQSGRLSTYLGDWHTHPGGSARLSRRDRRTLRAIGRSPDARCDRPVMLVLAGQEDNWVVAVWRLRLGGFLPKVLGRDIEPWTPCLHE